MMMMRESFTVCSAAATPVEWDRNRRGCASASPRSGARAPVLGMRWIIFAAVVGRSVIDCADSPAVELNAETGLPDGMTPLDLIEQRERQIEAKDQRIALQARARKPLPPSNGTTVFPRVTAPLQAPAGTAAGVCNPHTQIQAHKLWIQTDDGYDDARMEQYAQYLGTHEEAHKALRPTVLVYCKSELHVQSAVFFARLCGYKVTVRSGGHSYTGSSSCNFGGCMQLDLGGIRHHIFFRQLLS